jgi:hypothetical protein
VAKSSSIEGEGRLSLKVVNKDLIKEGEDSLPVPVRVLPKEPSSSQTEVPKRKSQCSMLKDKPGYQVYAAAPYVNAVNVKQLPNDIAVSIKSSRSVSMHSPLSETALVLSDSPPSTCSHLSGSFPQFKGNKTPLKTEERQLVKTAVSKMETSGSQHSRISLAAPVLPKPKPACVRQAKPSMPCGNKIESARSLQAIPFVHRENKPTTSAGRDRMHTETTHEQSHVPRSSLNMALPRRISSAWSPNLRTDVPQRHSPVKVVSKSPMSGGQYAPRNQTALTLSKTQPTSVMRPVPAVLGGNKPRPSPVAKTAAAWSITAPAHPRRVIPSLPPAQVEPG